MFPLITALMAAVDMSKKKGETADKKKGDAQTAALNQLGQLGGQPKEQPQNLPLTEGAPGYQWNKGPGLAAQYGGPQIASDSDIANAGFADKDEYLQNLQGGSP